jgi:hypothetical protein
MPQPAGYQISLQNPKVPYDAVTNPHPLYVFYKGCDSPTVVCTVSGAWGAHGYLP